MEEPKSVGWDAITQALEQLYDTQEPKHYGPMISYMLGGNDPLDGISVYIAEEPIEHWHFVTYGFSELYEKESNNLDYSGYGFELTFRLIKSKDEQEPPSWALNLLQNLARYVFNSGNIFKDGDYLDVNGPIYSHSNTKLTALAFIEDIELACIDTPNGKVSFIQIVGITADELEAMQIWNTLGVLNVCSSYMPHYITNLSRQSFLNETKVVDAVEKGSGMEGSNTGILFNEQVTWTSMKKGLFKTKPAVITFGAKQARTIGKIIQGRAIKRKSLELIGNEKRVVFSFGKQPAVIEKDNSIEVILDEITVNELTQQLQPVQKQFSVDSLNNVVFKIIKTEIKDQNGNVVETIG